MKKRYVTLGIKLTIVLFLCIFLCLNIDGFKYKNQIPYSYEYVGFSEEIKEKNVVKVHFYAARHDMSNIKIMGQVLPNNEGVIEVSLYTDKGQLLQSSKISYEKINAADGVCEFSIAPLHQGKIYTLEIRNQTENVENGYSVSVCHFASQEMVAWSFNDSMQEGLPSVTFTYSSYETELQLVLVCLVVILLSIFLPSLSERRGKLIYQTIVFFVAPLLVFYATEIMNMGGIEKIPPKPMLAGYLFILALYVVFYALLNRFHLAVVIASTIWMFCATVNHFVLQFRQTVFLPGDLRGAQTAMNVIDGYVFSFSKEFVLGMVVFSLVIFLALRDTLVLQKKVFRLVVAAVAVAYVCMACVFVSSPKAYEKADIVLDTWSQTTRSKDQGFFLNFAINVPYLINKAPKGYFPEELHSFLPTNAVDKEEKDIRYPHIITIMNESLADFSIIRGETYTSSNPFEFIHSLRDDDKANTFVGSVVIPVYGAGTNCSEFEMLTGFSLSMLNNTTAAPFAQFVYGDMPSIASHFRQLGYETMASHPGNSASWGRKSAFPLLGFDKAFFQNEGYFAGAEMMRGHHVSDKSNYDFLIEQFENRGDAPQYHYNLTMQNHGGYAFADFPATITIDESVVEGQYAFMEQYLTLLQKSDEAFAYLLSYFEAVEEPVIIMMFGDHWGAADHGYVEKLFATPMSEFSKRQQMTQHQTPLILWANYDVDFSDIPPLVSSNYLSAIVKNAAEIPLAPFDDFLLDLMEELPVISKFGYVDKNGDYYETLPEKYEELIHNYQKLIYNGLIDYDKRKWDIFEPFLG